MILQKNIGSAITGGNSIAGRTLSVLDLAGDIRHDGSDVLSQQMVSTIADQDDHCYDQGDLSRLDAPVIF